LKGKGVSRHHIEKADSVVRVSAHGSYKPTESSGLSTTNPRAGGTARNPESSQAFLIEVGISIPEQLCPENQVRIIGVGNIPNRNLA
jgi:hypothetical protein